MAKEAILKECAGCVLAPRGCRGRFVWQAWAVYSGGTRRYIVQQDVSNEQGVAEN